MCKYDYLIVGAGLYGAVFAYLAKQQGKSCLVIEKRDHIGGNIYTENIEGINVHKYGAHIFHTSNRRVWNFVNSIVEFNRYTNSPLANYKGKLYNLPFNMNTFYEMWGVTTAEEAQEKIDEQKADALAVMKRAGVEVPRNLEEQALVLIGKDIYEKLIKGYTEKQWGRRCSELPAFIIKRLPVRMVFDNNYFNDKYQGIPIGGYKLFVNKLLDSIETKTGVDFLMDRNYWQSMAEKVVFTGKIDEYYDYCYGNLAYRSLRFEHNIIDKPNYQSNAVINFTEREIPYTRIIEHKHFEMFGEEIYRVPCTVISHEYPLEWEKGRESYYPINDEKNVALYQQYKMLANEESNIIFGGRLAEYKYYDMGDVIEAAMSNKIFK